MAQRVLRIWDLVGTMSGHEATLSCAQSYLVIVGNGDMAYKDYYTGLSRANIWTIVGMHTLVP